MPPTHPAPGSRPRRRARAGDLPPQPGRRAPARQPIPGGAPPRDRAADPLRYQLGSSELSSPARARRADMSIDPGWGVNESISTLAAGTLTV